MPSSYTIIKAAPTLNQSGAGPVPTATPTSDTTNAKAEPLPEPTPVVYTVVQDESLWRICRRLLGNPLAYRQVAEENHIPDPNLIQPGQKLLLSAVADAATPAPPACATPIPKALQITPTLNQSGSGPTPVVAFPNWENHAFGPGERLVFSVEYLGVAAGFATLEVETGPVMHNRPTLHIIASARTHPAFEWFFKVRDRIESYLDARGMFSWQYEKHLREGGYSNDSVFIYDQLNRQVVKDEGRTKMPARAWTQDVLSEFYSFRVMPFNLGDTITIPVLADDGKDYDLIVHMVRRERITVPAGTFDCVVAEPTLKFEGLFQQKGKITIWITDDARRVPVLIKSQIIIGSIDIVLREAVVLDQ